MKCPRCQKDMNLTMNDVSFGNDGKEYDRGIYHCEVDDVWIVIEVPKKN